jgi:nucleotide-binding universal stress UspA family protein
MYGVIVAGTDGSPSSLGCVRHALELAKATGSRLQVVAVVRPGDASVMAAEGMGAAMGRASVAIQEAVQTHLAAVLDDVAKECQRAGVEAETSVVHGQPAQVLCDVAEAVQAGLIVVGNRGMKGARRFLGSVPNAVAHGASCAVLVVPTT